MLGRWGLRWLCGFILLVPGLSAAEDSHGLILYERFLGSSNTLANVFRLDTTVGYSFNKYSRSMAVCRSSLSAHHKRSPAPPARHRATASATSMRNFDSHF